MLVGVVVQPRESPSAPAISTIAWCPVISGGVPGNSNPASLRTTLRPPSQPTSQPAVNVCPPACTVTSASPVSKPVTETPRRTSTPSSAARSARIASTCCWDTNPTSSTGPWPGIDPHPRLTAAVVLAAFRAVFTTTAARMLAGEKARDVLADHLAAVNHAFDTLAGGLK
jgi:hypothetical protein